VKATRTRCARPSQTAQPTPTRRSFLDALALAPVAAGASPSAVPDPELVALLRRAEAAAEAFAPVSAEMDRLHAADFDGGPEDHRAASDYEKGPFSAALMDGIRARRELAEAIRARGARGAFAGGLLVVAKSPSEAGPDAPERFEDDSIILGPADVIGWPPAVPTDPELARLADAVLDGFDEVRRLYDEHEPLVGPEAGDHYLHRVCPAVRRLGDRQEALDVALTRRGLAGIVRRGTLLVALSNQIDRPLPDGVFSTCAAVPMAGIAGLGAATEGGAR
jgi:hypothetical protein